MENYTAPTQEQREQKQCINQAYKDAEEFSSLTNFLAIQTVLVLIGTIIYLCNGPVELYGIAFANAGILFAVTSIVGTYQAIKRAMR